MWRVLLDKTYKWMWHCVSPSLALEIAAELRENGADLEIEEKKSLNFETNGGWGMRMMNWPNFTIELSENRQLQLDADIVSVTLIELTDKEKAWKETASGQKYRKLYSRWGVLALNEADVEKLLSKLKELMPEATRVEEEFDAEVAARFKKLTESGHFVQVKPKKGVN